MRDCIFPAIEEEDVILIKKWNLKPKVVRVPADRLKLCKIWFKKYGMPDVRIRHNHCATAQTIEDVLISNLKKVYGDPIPQWVIEKYL